MDVSAYLYVHIYRRTRVPSRANPYVCAFAVLQAVFQVTPLSMDEWVTVMKFSVPVVLLDEVLKFMARKVSDGEGSWFDGLQWIVLMWAVFFGVIIYGPL